VLVEADGAARKPFKAPNDDEPVIPRATTLVVAVVGIDALGRPVSEAAHRPERVTALTGLGPADVLDARSIARVMLAERGVMKGAPAGARTVVLVNKADDAARLRDARSLARELMAQGAQRVVVAALERGDAIIEVSRRS
jgi:probable selenium-dependent hydroxylase accessory protein YqeC